MQKEFLYTNLTYEQKTEIINAATSLGFDIVRVTSADPFPETKAIIQERIALGFFEGMDWYTAERSEVSTDPRALLPQARSIITMGTFYLTEAPRDLTTQGEPHGQISCYAWGEDYHDIIKDRLHQLANIIHQMGKDSPETRVFVDTGRMVDRAAAQRAGLGWFGKNTNILTKKWGSWLFLSEIVTTLDLPPDPPIAASCGRCTACLEACPTGALPAPGVLDARLCISYLTIEHRGAIPLHLRPLIGNLIYGCDICQQVCPVNQIAERRLRARDELGSSSMGEERRSMFQARVAEDSSPELIPLLALTEEEFRERFRRSPIKRVKRRGFLRNVCVALGNLRDPAAIPGLIGALHDRESLIRSHAAWALGQIGGEQAYAALQTASKTEVVPEIQSEIAQAIAATNIV
jgi:epoxyqueuosine reductase